MKALILAAGLGTRLRPYTLTTPKAMFTLAGRPLLDIHIRNLAAAGCEAVGVNTHHLPGPIRAFVASQRFEIPVALRHEPAILGTGGAIRNWTDFWDQRPFMVINADIFTTIDLRQVYEFHLRHRPAATLVLVDDPEFNTVSVEAGGRVKAFAETRAEAPAGALTFTGIQVLDPVVLDYLPARGSGHSIDAFRDMIAAGLTVLALVPQRGEWKDLGTPARYREAAAAATAREAWRRAYSEGAPETTFRVQPIAGDGSDRKWSRWSAAGGSMILADHGLRVAAGTAEVDAFIAIGRHLRARGVPVPAIYFADPFAGVVFLEDLGDTSLQAAVQALPSREQVKAAYRTVIDAVMHMAVEGVRGFDSAWTYQTPAYTREVILERECLYFRDAFLVGYAGLEIAEDFGDEFSRIADGALEGAQLGFMHRDLQSRNVMLQDGRWYFIDFQGGRLGPLQYDLAALLIDPYVGLAPEEQDELLDYAMQALARRRPVDPVNFRRIYAHCALSRNLQALGAFGFLSSVKGKPQFARHIPAALRGLEARLRGWAPPGFPKLQRWTAQALARLGI
jgi:aminoglycoside/choline kinase family phosphotransferase/GTP:adenosylcobinamide-phosphate guanylyltransferase